MSLLVSVVAFFGYTLNPMSKVQDKIEYFKTNYQHQIGTFRGVHRDIGYAFAGNSKSRAIIFIHGSPGSKESWYAYLLNPLLASKFHLIAVDRPGYGDSGGDSELSLKKQAEDIWAVMKINNSEKLPILVGHSYGGPVIAQIGVLNPKKVGALVFVASSVDPELEETKFIQKIGNLWGIRSIIPNDLRVCNEEILALKQELKVLSPKWHNIKARIALIHGDKDDLVPVENVDYINSKLKVDSLQILPGVNHFIPWQHSSTIEKAILELNSLDS